MGCDIHVHIERYDDKDNEWKSVRLYAVDTYLDTIAYCEPNIWRNYDLFAHLAGVRNYDGVVPISAPRGLPDDVGYHVTREYERWAYDAHSASWLSFDELQESENESVRDFYKHLLFYCDTAGCYQPNNNLRVIFWFDS